MGQVLGMGTEPLLVAALLSLAALPTQRKKTVLVVTDAEGVAGICRQEQVEPTNLEPQKRFSAVPFVGRHARVNRGGASAAPPQPKDDGGGAAK